MAKHILVADDSATIRKFVSTSLSMLGYTVTIAQDGMDALEKLAGQQVDLVITDLNMPNVDGFEFIKSLRELDAYKTIPIIILSSLSSPEDVTRGMSLGANSYVNKPFDPKRIQYEVAKYLN